MIMKNKRIFLKKCLLLACCCFIVLGCKDDESDFVLELCDTGTEFLGDTPKMNVLLFKQEAPEGIARDQKILTFSGSDATLSYDSGILTIMYICNFPEELKKWDIPASGLPLSIKGRKYDYDGVVPADRAVYYLELTYVKRL